MRRARTAIDSDNAATLSFLELMNFTDAAFYDAGKKKTVAAYIEDNGITRSSIAKYAPCFPDRAMRTLVESGGRLRCCTMTEGCSGRPSFSLPKPWGLSQALLKRTSTSQCFCARFPQSCQRWSSRAARPFPSACKLIQRFSEDIDLNLEGEKRPSEGQRRHLKESIVSTIEEFGFALRDPDRVMSRRDYKPLRH